MDGTPGVKNSATLWNMLIIKKEAPIHSKLNQKPLRVREWDSNDSPGNDRVSSYNDAIHRDIEKAMIW